MSLLEIGGLLAAGSAIGAYASTVGVGGGFLIAPLLLWRHADAPPEAITAASLSVVALLSGVAASLGTRDGRVDHSLVAALASVAIGGSLLGAAGTALLPRDAFTIGFGVLLVLIAGYLVVRPEVSFIEPGAGGWRRERRDARGAVFVYRVPMRRSLPAAFGVSVVASLSGAGAGLLLVPLATHVMRMPHWFALPTAQGMVFVIGATGALFQLAAGHADLSNAGPMADALWLGIGVVVAAPLGRQLNRRLGASRLTRLLALGIVAVAVRTLISAL